MGTHLSWRWVRSLILLACASLAPLNAYADIDSNGILDKVLEQYAAAATNWGAIITTHASWLFWTLALISMVWTFGMLALRRADIAEFFAEFARFTIFTGFYWWLLINGPNFANSIITSLRQIGGQAAGSGAGITPSGIVDVGFAIFLRVIQQSTVWQPVDFALGVIIAIIVLVVLALVSVNMLVLLISGWILAYAGIFFLGFGGSRWTSEMAITYFKTVLSLAAQLLTMILLVGIGKSFIDLYYTNMHAGIRLTEMAVMLVVAIVLLALVNKVPSLVGGLAMGGGTGALGGGLGVGAAVGAAAMAGAAVATAGAAAAAGVANIAGGSQALMAAFKKASAAESAGSGMNDLSSAVTSTSQSDSSSGNSSDALASAMGDSSQDRSDQSGSGHSDTTALASTGTSSHADGSVAGNVSGVEPAQQAQSFQGGASPSTTGARKAAGTAAKVGRIAVGTTAALARGTWDVAKNKAGEVIDAASNRIAESTGGKIAAAISASYETSNAGENSSSVENEDGLAPGKDHVFDAATAAEIAAFRDSK